LVIDDQAGLSELIQRYAADRALEVLAASDALTGLKLAREIRPGAILLDLMMPGMDGWELLQRLRTTPDTADLPVVICSVINDPELAYSLGASYFLAKPITREALMVALAQIGL
jgi:CheY-like chemotaxis protein